MQIAHILVWLETSYAKFSSALVEKKFQQSATNHSLFIKRDGSRFIALLVYIDDIIIASNDDLDITKLKKTLDTMFKLKDLGPLGFFLGLEIAISSKGITMSQKPYAL